MADNQVKIRVGADLTQTDAALDAFAGRAQDSLARVSPAVADVTKETKKLDNGILNARESARLASEELGIHLPRAVSGAVAKAVPEIGLIGPALLGIFAAAEIPKFIDQVDAAASALGGYTDEVRKAEKADIDASLSALVHFKTIAEGTKLVAETQKALADLASKQGNWNEVAKASDEQMGNMNSLLRDALGPIGGAINLWYGYKAAVQESSDTEGRAAQLRERLVEQLDQLGNLQSEQYKEAAEDAKKAARHQEEAAREAGEAWEHSTEESYNYFAERRKQSQKEFDDLVRLSEKLIKQEDRTREVQEETNFYFLEQQARMEHQVEEKTTKGLEQSERRIQGQFKELEEHAKRVRIEWANAHPLAANIIEDLKSMGIEAKNTSVAKMELTAVTAQFTRAATEEVMAVQKNIAASGEQLAAGLAGLIGGRRAQAAVEAVWEVGRGIACLAEGTWPPNPAAIIAGGLHFEAAAQYALVAGSGGGRRSVSSAGVGGSPGVDHGGFGGGSSASPMPPQTLAPGAASQGGRFGSLGSGIIVVHGSMDLHQMVAGLVNGAVERGITVTATASQRGAPVGH